MESYEVILQRMKDKFKQMSGCEADNASDIGIRLKVLAGEIFSVSNNIEWLKRQVFANTAEGKYLDYHASERGIERKKAVCSRGTLRFSSGISAENDIQIPKGFICRIGGVNNLSVETLETGVIRAGEIHCDIQARSKQAGATSNAAQNTIKIMSNDIIGIRSVNNPGAFFGGADEETDNELRLRIVDSYRNIPNGTNRAFYRSCALKYDDVYSAQAVKTAAGKVSVYVAAKGSTVSNETILLIKKDIDSLREVNVEVSVMNAELVSTDVSFTLQVKSDYTQAKVQESCKTALREYFLSLSVGQSICIPDIIDTIYHVDGVKNFKLAGDTSWSIDINQNELAIIGNISIMNGGI